MPPIMNANMNMNMIYSGIVGGDIFNQPIKIGDFKILEQLGKGAHCPVYKVIYKPSGKIYAIKVYERLGFTKTGKDLVAVHLKIN